MKRVYIFYFLIIGTSLLTFMPVWYEVLLGMFITIIASVRFGMKSGFCTVAILAALKVVDLIIINDLNYMNSIISIIMSSLIGVLFVFYLGSEIQRRKNTEKELNEKITLLQSLMDTVPTPIFFKDLEGMYIGCNYAFEQDYGISEKDLIGKRVNDLFDIELAEKHNKMDAEIIKNKGKQVYEMTTKFTDGGKRDVLYCKTLLTDEYGNPKGIVGVLTDITDKKEREKLKKNIEEEECIIEEMLRNDKMKTQFFANISHELRTPINVILGAAQVMEIYTQDSQYIESQSKVIRNVASIKLNCLRLLRLVNNIIDITQIDVDAFEMNLKNRDIVHIVEEITLSVSDYVNNKGIDLQFDTDIEEKIMAFDDVHIERIMLNLLSNAIKFTQNKGSIYVYISDSANGVCIQVRDTGIGIPMNRQSEIFQRFCQIRPLFTKPQEGSGIGLSLVKSLVELHGGNIRVESETGIGTTFSVFLPNRLVKEEELQKEEVLEKQAQVEKIQLEFSDIYYVTEYQIAM